MDLQYLRRLVKIFDDSTAAELEIEEEGTKIYISKPLDKPEQTLVQMQPAIQPTVQQAVQVPQPQAAEALNPASTAPVEAPAEEDSSLHAITSPIVGTFYKAPSPDSDPFVEIGTKVKPGTTLCIVEAMKLMNEIESDVAGTVEKILLQNAEGVEYGQKMFLIKPE